MESSRAFQSATRTVDVYDESWDTLALVEGIYILVERAYHFTAEGSCVVELARGAMGPAADSVHIQDVIRVALALVGGVDKLVGTTDGLADVEVVVED